MALGTICLPLAQSREQLVLWPHLLQEHLARREHTLCFSNRRAFTKRTRKGCESLWMKWMITCAGP